MAFMRVARAGLAVCFMLLGGASAHAQAVLAKGTPVLDVQSPAVLSRLEQKGFGLPAILSADGAGTLRELYRDSLAYRSLADKVGQDVLAVRQEMQANSRMLYVVQDEHAGHCSELEWLQS